VRCVASAEEALDPPPRAALVCAPPGLHVPLAIEAARRGCDLFLEKPLAHSLEGVAALEREVAARGLVAMVACNMRFHHGPATLRNLLMEGAVGEPVWARIHSSSWLPRWRPGQDYRGSYTASPDQGGALRDCIHEIDLALWLLGPARLRAAAVLPARPIGLEVDGLAELLLEHAGGALSSVHVDFVTRDYRRGITVAGTRGTLDWDFGSGEVRRFGEDGAPVGAFPEPPGWETNRMYLSELEHFLRCVRTRSAPANGIAGGAAALRIALEARGTGAGA
jgi:predicted dehydrogenase